MAQRPDLPARSFSPTNTRDIKTQRIGVQAPCHRRQKRQPKYQDLEPCLPQLQRLPLQPRKYRKNGRALTQGGSERRSRLGGRALAGDSVPSPVTLGFRLGELSMEGLLAQLCGTDAARPLPLWEGDTTGHCFTQLVLSVLPHALLAVLSACHLGTPRWVETATRYQLTSLPAVSGSAGSM